MSRGKWLLASFSVPWPPSSLFHPFSRNRLSTTPESHPERDRHCSSRLARKIKSSQTQETPDPLYGKGSIAGIREKEKNQISILLISSFIFEHGRIKLIDSKFMLYVMYICRGYLIGMTLILYHK